LGVQFPPGLCGIEGYVGKFVGEFVGMFGGIV
jgi:hypothetical protein